MHVCVSNVERHGNHDAVHGTGMQKHPACSGTMQMVPVLHIDESLCGFYIETCAYAGDSTDMLGACWHARQKPACNGLHMQLHMRCARAVPVLGASMSFF